MNSFHVMMMMMMAHPLCHTSVDHSLVRVRVRVRVS